MTEFDCDVFVTIHKRSLGYGTRGRLHHPRVGERRIAPPLDYLGRASARDAGLAKRLPGIQEPGGVGVEDARDLVPDSAEDGQLLVFGACCVRWIIETPVVATHLARENWARLVGISAYGDDGRDLIG